MLQTNMFPRISGGTRVDMFNNEFLSRLSLIMSPWPTSIRFSKARIESRFFSCQPILGVHFWSVPGNGSEQSNIHRSQWLLSVSRNRRPAFSGVREDATRRGRTQGWRTVDPCTVQAGRQTQNASRSQRVILGKRRMPE